MSDDFPFLKTTVLCSACGREEVLYGSGTADRVWALGWEVVSMPTTTLGSVKVRCPECSAGAR